MAKTAERRSVLSSQPLRIEEPLECLNTTLVSGDILWTTHSFRSDNIMLKGLKFNDGRLPQSKKPSSFMVWTKFETRWTMSELSGTPGKSGKSDVGSSC